MEKLTSQRCVPCEGGTPPLETTKVQELLAEVGSDWELIPATANDAMRIRRKFKFENFVEAMKFANHVAVLAEAEGHHPVMKISFGKVKIDLWTHAVGGLSTNDFILAAKINEIK